MRHLVILVFALSACNGPTPTMTIEVPEQLRSAQGSIEELAGWIWIFPQEEAPPTPSEVEDTFADEDGIGALASRRVELDGIASGASQTVDIELAPGDYWVQVWFVDVRFEPSEDPLPLLAHASTAPIRVSQHEMSAINTDEDEGRALLPSEESFDWDGDGQSNLDEIVAGTNPYDPLSRTCGLDGPVSCQPRIISEQIFDAPPNGARQLLVASPEPSPQGTVILNHASVNPSEHALTLIRPGVRNGAPEEIDLLTSQANPFADVALSPGEGPVVWCDAVRDVIFTGGYNTSASGNGVLQVAKELEVHGTVLYWSAWDVDNSRTHIVTSPAENPSVTDPPAPFVVPDPPIQEQGFDELLLRVADDGDLYISADGTLWEYDPAGTLVGQIFPGVTLTDFVPGTDEVFSMELTVLWCHSMTTTDDVMLVSDFDIAPPLVQDRSNIYWLSGARTKIRGIAKDTASFVGEANDDYNIVVIPNGIRSFTIVDDGFNVRTLYLIDEDGQLQRVFL